MNADLAIYRLVRERGVQRFAWGSSDCVVWPCDCVQAITGRDPMADLRGRYSTAEEALQILRNEGGMPRFLSRRFGEEVPLADVQPGDVLLLHRHAAAAGEHGALGVAWRGGLLAQADTALAYGLFADARRAWRPRP